MRINQKNGVFAVLLFGGMTGILVIGLWLHSYNYQQPVKRMPATLFDSTGEWSPAQDGVCVPCETLMVDIIRHTVLVDSNLESK